MNQPRDGTFSTSSQRQAGGGRRGRLSIFFGAPGAGKTWALLAAAHRLTARGVAVTVAWIQLGDRAELEAGLDGLERLPLRALDQAGERHLELDLEAVLRLRPAVLVLGALEHVNPPGARHARRWQEVEALLDAGIDVLTTLDVRHVESLRDLVAEVTGVSIEETVPDRVLEAADELELVDRSSPADLRSPAAASSRSEGSTDAIGELDSGAHLALRALAARQAAAWLEAKMQAYRDSHAIDRPWPVAERLLVAVGPSPGADRVVRSGRRLARRLHAEWLAVYVETPELAQASEADREPVWQALRLAEQLGAATAVLSGRNVEEELLRFARQRNVSKIVLGKPRRRGGWQALRRSVRDDLLRRSPGVDVYLVAGEGEQPAPEPLRRRRRSGLDKYALATLAITTATLLCAAIAPHLDHSNLVMVYLLTVVAVAVRLGRGPSVLASLLAVAAFDFFFVLPYYTFAVANKSYLWTFTVMLVVALTISTLTARLRRQAEASSARERRANALYLLSRDLAEAPFEGAWLHAAVRHTAEVFGARVIVLMPTAGGGLEPRAGDADAFGWNEEDEARAARWVFDFGRPAGRTTDTLPNARGLYVPLPGPVGDVLGVLGLSWGGATPELAVDQLHLLETFANQLALALRRPRRQPAAAS